MTTNWKRVSNKCRVCGERVGDFKLKPRKGGKNSGKKRVVGKKYENFGSFLKLKGTSELESLCRKCQSKNT